MAERRHSRLSNLDIEARVTLDIYVFIMVFVYKLKIFYLSISINACCLLSLV